MDHSTTPRRSTRRSTVARLLVIGAALGAMVGMGTTPAAAAIAPQPIAGCPTTYSFEGAILWRYMQYGGKDSPLGCPTSGSSRTTNGAGYWQNFQRGMMTWKNSVAGAGVFVVLDPIAPKFRTTYGGPGGTLGFPTTDTGPVYGVTGELGLLQGFDNGQVFSAGAGVFAVQGPMLGQYLYRGGPGGQLGFPVTEVQSVPSTNGFIGHFERGIINWSEATGGTILPPPSTVKQVEASQHYSCALMTDGQVRCWGSTTRPDGNRKVLTTPAALSGVGQATQIATGSLYACALIAGGQVKCWDYYDNRPPATVAGVDDAVQISAGPKHACAVTRAKTMKCWGSNTYGELGTGTTVGSTIVVAGITNAVRVTAGGSFGEPWWPSHAWIHLAHTCALLETGQVTCWGHNGSGQLGGRALTPFGSPPPLGYATPQVVGGLSGVTDVAAGQSHTCARIAGGAVRCWGANGEGELGNGTKTDSTAPVAVTGLSGATALSAGRAGTCALVGTAVRCWGSGFTTPLAIGGLPAVSQVSVGDGPICALDGPRPWCWGRNDYGQLGDGTTIARAAPGRVSGLG